jgi:hypothetical protein
VTWARVSSLCVAVAVALVIIANAPAVLTDTLQTAIAQIRVNAATSPRIGVAATSDESSTTAETPVKKIK